MIKKLINKLLKPSDSISFKESMDLAELPVITFHQGLQKINFLLDSGSNNCIIDKNFLPNIEHYPLDTNTNLYGLEGNKQQAQLCNIATTYKENAFVYTYVIQDMSSAFSQIKQETGVTIHGILGTKFFNHYKYVLDFADLIAYTKK